MPLKLYLSEPYYRTGFMTLIQHLHMESFLGVKINTLYFPDMRYLLAWSRSPQLPDNGLTLISGSERVISSLRGILSTRHIMLAGSYDTLTNIKAELHLRLLDAAVFDDQIKYIRFTSAEMEYMWNYIRGIKTSSPEGKRDSRIRRRVMGKIGADNIVSFIVRFRLLFALDDRFLLQQVKMRNFPLKGNSDVSRHAYVNDVTAMGKIFPCQSEKLNILDKLT